MQHTSSWTPRFITLPHGLRLFMRDYNTGSTARTPLLCLAGLTRNAADFSTLAERMSTGQNARRVIAIDSCGRGYSDYADDASQYTPAQEAQDVLYCLEYLQLDKICLIGTSRGGILAMLMAHMRPDLLQAVILNDIGARIETHGLLRIKAYLNAMPAFATWHAALQALKVGAGAQFTQLSDENWHKFARQIFIEKNGQIIGNFDPKIAQTLDNVTEETPNPSLEALFEALKPVPTLVIRGALSDLLSVQTLHDMHTIKPDMESFEVPHEGHAPLLMDTQTLHGIEQFLQKTSL